jgi:hypothetical protein
MLSYVLYTGTLKTAQHLALLFATHLTFTHSSPSGLTPNKAASTHTQPI